MVEIVHFDKIDEGNPTINMYIFTVPLVNKSIELIISKFKVTHT